jgi:conjugative transfer pilus assembly protein TraH
MLIAVGVGFFVAGVTLAIRNFFSYHLKTLFILKMTEKENVRMEDLMFIRKPLSVLCGMLLGLSFTAAADVNGDMNNFFNKLGFASNTSQPQVWQGQAAGYASGGSLYARTQVKTIQLVSMTLPDINAGCGGIDAYLGSFSFINSEQLQRFANKSCPTPRATSLTLPCRPRYRRSKPQRTSFRRWPAT